MSTRRAARFVDTTRHTYACGTRLCGGSVTEHAVVQEASSLANSQSREMGTEAQRCPQVRALFTRSPTSACARATSSRMCPNSTLWEAEGCSIAVSPAELHRCNSFEFLVRTHGRLHPRTSEPLGKPGQPSLCTGTPHLVPTETRGCPQAPHSDVNSDTRRVAHVSRPLSAGRGNQVATAREKQALC